MYFEKEPQPPLTNADLEKIAEMLQSGIYAGADSANHHRRLLRRSRQTASAQSSARWVALPGIRRITASISRSR
jgi:hypothetical protein